MNVNVNVYVCLLDLSSNNFLSSLTKIPKMLYFKVTLHVLYCVDKNLSVAVSSGSFLVCSLSNVHRHDCS